MSQQWNPQKHVHTYLIFRVKYDVTHKRSICWKFWCYHVERKYFWCFKIKTLAPFLQNTLLSSFMKFKQFISTLLDKKLPTRKLLNFRLVCFHFEIFLESKSIVEANNKYHQEIVQVTIPCKSISKIRLSIIMNLWEHDVCGEYFRFLCSIGGKCQKFHRTTLKFNVLHNLNVFINS